MTKQLHDPSIQFTFTHSLPLHHVLAYLRTTATLRRSARESLEMAARYNEGVRMRTWLEAVAEKEMARADAAEHLVKLMACKPPAKPLVVDYMTSVLHPARSGEDLDAFTGEVERCGVGSQVWVSTTFESVACGLGAYPITLDALATRNG